MKNIFIVGGAGYVGSVLIPKLLQRNYKVTCFDLMIYGENLLKKHENLKIIKGDMRDQNLLKNIIKDFDSVIHLACISNDPSFELNPDLGKSINFDAFEPLVKICENSSINQFIYASSSSVYGIKNEQNVNEKMSLEPLTDYSKFKVKCEEVLQKYNSKNFTTTIIRPATVCGYSPRQRLDVVVNILTNLAYHKKNIKIMGGKQLRPNIHIEDMADAYIKILESNINKISGEIFNVGFENQTVNKIADIVEKNMPFKITKEIIESNDNRSYHISSKKILDKLNFLPKKNISNAVLDLIDKFEKKIFSDPLNNSNYFNVKKMNEIKLK
tara:strand:+ start:174 stop:1154 length:981 start_codon:yes stop_codon:yes gene_type:complete